MERLSANRFTEENQTVSTQKIKRDRRISDTHNHKPRRLVVKHQASPPQQSPPYIPLQLSDTTAAAADVSKNELTLSSSSMDDMSNVFPYFDSTMEENVQIVDDLLDYAENTRQDLSFSEFLIANTSSNSVEIPQMNVDMITQVPVNNFDPNMIPMSYNHPDLLSNPTGNLMNSTQSGHLMHSTGFHIGDPMDSTYTGQHQMDSTYTGQHQMDSTYTGQHQMDSINTGQIPMDSINTGQIPMDSINTGQQPPMDSINTGQQLPMNSTNTGQHPMDSNTNEGLFLQPPNYGFRNPRPLSEWPILPIPFTCSCCHVLREFMHTKGDNNLTRLEVHGTLGVITHAILEISSIVDGNRRNEYQMFDFCKKSIEIIRDWLEKYCKDRRKAGFKLIQDPLLLYYEALCIGLYGDDYLDFDDLWPYDSDGGNNNGASSSGANNNNDGGEFHIFQGNQQQQQQPPPQQQQQQQPQQEQQQQPQQQQQEVGAENNGGGRAPRTSLAAQRVRTGMLSLKDLREHFHVSMEDAAKRMNVCLTVMKKVCRREGLSRWPYRKIKSIQTKISGKQTILNTKDGVDKRRIRVEIEALEKQIQDLIEGILR